MEYNKVTTAKMLAGTKTLLKELNIEGKNEQEKLDNIVKIYKEQLDATQGVIIEEVKKVDLTDEFESMNKDFGIFMKDLEQKVNKQLTYNTEIAISNAQNDFKKLHRQFLDYVSNAEVLSTEKEKELEEKKQLIEDMNN